MEIIQIQLSGLTYNLKRTYENNQSTTSQQNLAYLMAMGISRMEQTHKTYNRHFNPIPLYLLTILPI